MEQGKIDVRHGDVGMFIVSSLPEGAVERKNPIVALGEATGHCHTVIPLEGVVADEADFKLYEKDGVLYLWTGKKGARLDHQEHAKTPLLKETFYRIGLQREWHPQGFRNVMD